MRTAMLTHSQTEQLKQMWFRALNSSPAQHQVFDPLNGFLCVLTVMEVTVGGAALSLAISCAFAHTHLHTNTETYKHSSLTTAAVKKLLMLMNISPLFVARGVPSMATTIGGLLPCKRSPWESLWLTGRPAAARLVQAERRWADGAVRRG